MALPQFSMRELIEAGVHFGHKTKRWNPKMSQFIYGTRNNVHIIDLQQTVPMLHQALQAIREVVAKNGRVLFVGTKHQAVDIISDAAKRCGQYYVNRRWLGGMLTNWHTIQTSIKRLRKLEEQFAEGIPAGFTKKEVLDMQRERDKLDKSLGGIKEMGGLPDMLIIIDTNKEDLAVKEASRLGIPIVAVLDSNSSPDGITYPVPGNDDATRAIKLYCHLFSDAVLDGIQASMAASGVDVGASADAPAELMPEGNVTGKEGEESARGGDKGKGRKAPAVVVKKAGKLKEAGAEEADQEDTAKAEDEAAKPKKTTSKKPLAKKKAS